MADNSDLAMADFEDLPMVGVASAMYKEDNEVDAMRFDLALETIHAYRENGLPLLVVNASTNPYFADTMRERGAYVMQAPRPGLASQYIDGVAAVLNQGAERIVRHEPEKVRMVDFHEQIVEALGACDILVIGRTERAMRSIPTTQARTERLAGWLLEEHFDFPPDALSGGRGYTRRGAEYLTSYDLDRLPNNWVHLYTPVLEAMRDDVPVGSLLVDLMHPAAMVELEEGNPEFDSKRFAQFFDQLDVLLKSVGYEPGPESPFHEEPAGA